MNFPFHTRSIVKSLHTSTNSLYVSHSNCAAHTSTSHNCCNKFHFINFLAASHLLTCVRTTWQPAWGCLTITCVWENYVITLVLRPSSTIIKLLNFYINKAIHLCNLFIQRVGRVPKQLYCYTTQMLNYINFYATASVCMHVCKHDLFSIHCCCFLNEYINRIILTLCE